jgi:Zn-dependent M28 family amino/carboxypeptidase
MFALRMKSLAVALAVFLALSVALTRAQVAASADVPVDVEALMETVRTLSSPAFEGRRTGTPGNAKARALVTDRFRSSGLTPLGRDFELPFKFTRNADAQEGVNIAAICPGRGAPDKGAFVISAHYDHVGVRDGSTYPGADDNASGVAVLLELAQHCRRSPWAHDVIFVAFDAEELGLQGAKAFVSSPPVPRERLALNVNLDMVSRSAARELYVAGTYHRPSLKTVLDPIAAKAPIKLLFGHDQPKPQAGGQDDWTMQSDHGAFHAAGIPFVYFGVEDHPDYHKPTDTAEKIDKVFFGQVAETIRAAITALDRARLGR